MKSISIILRQLILSVALIFASCHEIDDCFKSTGGESTENRPVGDFTDINVYDNINVVLTQDSVNSIVVDAGDHLQSEIITEVKDGQLTVKNDNSCNWVRTYKRKIFVYVHVKSIKTINHFGSENITSTNTLIADDFIASNRTSGDITLSVNAHRVYPQTHVAAGDVTLSGKADELYAYDICQGVLHCENLVAKYVSAACKSTGDVYVNAIDNMDIEIRGDGSIYYYGNPSVNQNINTGSGQLIHLPK